MELTHVPAFRVVANSADITEAIRARFKNLRLTDATGVISDTLEITLADHDPAQPITLPPTGAELELFLGYGEDLRRMGLFVVDEVELSGPPSELVIRARAAPQEESSTGRVELQSQKTRTWERGTTLGDMVGKIAGEHGLTPAVSAALASIALPKTDQVSESDMNMLHRLGRQYDAIAKPGGGRLLFVVRGDAAAAGGADMPRVALTPPQCTDYRVVIARRDGAGTVVAYYRIQGAPRRRQVRIGEGEPTRQLRMGFPDRESAEAAARAELRRRARAEHSLSVTLPGRSDLLAESLVTLAGFREGVAGDWLVTRAEHYIGPGGYRVSIDAERPNSDADVITSSGGDADDADQVADVEG